MADAVFNAVNNTAEFEKKLNLNDIRAKVVGNGGQDANVQSAANYLDPFKLYIHLLCCDDDGKMLNIKQRVLLLKQGTYIIHMILTYKDDMGNFFSKTSML